MAEPGRGSESPPQPDPGSLPSSSSGAATLSSDSHPSSSSSHVWADEEAQNGGGDRFIHHENHFPAAVLEEEPIGDSYSWNLWTLCESSTRLGDDTCSCVVVVLTFWFFVSMTMILGVYGPMSLSFGPGSSILILPSPVFVQSIKVQQLNESNNELELYGFYESPPLDVVSTWSETLNASVSADSHKEFIYFLNKGSQINISYNVESDSSSVYLIIAQGNEGLARWLEDPEYPNTTLSWNIIHGSGMIKQKIWESTTYYIALGNLNSEVVEVQLDLRVQALMYNTSNAYSKCLFTHGVCTLSVPFPRGNAFVLDSFGVGEGSTNDEWEVKLYYGPRWLTYIVGTGILTVLMLVAFNVMNNFQSTRGDESRQTASERAPLLSHKDDDILSWGSSYDSVTTDEEDIEDSVAGTVEGKSLRDGGDGNNTRRLCAICFDAPRDCFFLPCGHCVACFACGTRIAEAAGTCPICRRSMKKVRKIFTV